MKKSILAAILFLSASEAFAETTPEYGASKGDFSTEIQLSPFNSDYTLKLDALKLRYFASDNDALIFKFGISALNGKDVPDTDADDYYTTHYNGWFSLGVGYERHFFHYKRIDLYAGASIDYIHGFAGAKKIEKGVKAEICSGYGNIDDVSAFDGFAIDIFTGIDFYIYKGLYCGAELGINMQDRIVSGYTIRRRNLSKVEVNRGGHQFLFNTSVEPLIRVGWTF